MRSPKKQSLFSIWWGKVIFGVAGLGLTYLLHTAFLSLETGKSESVRVPWYIALLYYTLGHIPTIVLVGLIALGILIFGLWQFAQEGDAEPGY